MLILFWTLTSSLETPAEYGHPDFLLHLQKRNCKTSFPFSLEIMLQDLPFVAMSFPSMITLLLLPLINPLHLLLYLLFYVFLWYLINLEHIYILHGNVDSHRLDIHPVTCWKCISTCGMTLSTIPLRDRVHWLWLGSHTDLNFGLNLDLVLPASRVSRMPSIYLHL